MKLVVVQVIAQIILSVFPSVKGFFDRNKKLALLLFTMLVLALVAVLFTGCSLLQLQDPKLAATKTYRKSLKFEVDKKIYEGVAVLPRKPYYDITIIPEDKMEFYIFQTPHRDDPMPKPKTGWFSNKVEYRYTPQVGVEDQGYMPLEIAALNNKQIYDGFAFILFQDARPEYSLGANLRCNGIHSMPSGVSICQTAKGLLQEIFFQQKVIIEDVGSECAMPESQDGFFWKLKVSEGECPYVFTAREFHKNGKRLKHRLTTIGYGALTTGD